MSLTPKWYDHNLHNVEQLRSEPVKSIDWSYWFMLLVVTLLASTAFYAMYEVGVAAGMRQERMMQQEAEHGR